LTIHESTMPRPKKNTTAPGSNSTDASVTGAPQGLKKKHATQQSVDQAIWSICDIMRRGNVSSALQYVPELTWILFLRILDETEDREAAEAEAVGARYTPSLEKPYRWKDWAAPAPKDAPETWTNKRKELEEGPPKGFLAFCNGELIPYLKGLRDKPQATSRQKVISEIMSGVTCWTCSTRSTRYPRSTSATSTSSRSARCTRGCC
jgi:type I restriction enzyme M protein